MLNKIVFGTPNFDPTFPMYNNSQLISDAVDEACMITQAPKPMIYLAAITSVSFACQSIINVELPFGKSCPTSLMGLTVADSGERKSAVEKLVAQGIKKFYREQQKRQNDAQAVYQITREVHKKKERID